MGKGRIRVEETQFSNASLAGIRGNTCRRSGALLPSPLPSPPYWEAPKGLNPEMEGWHCPGTLHPTVTPTLQMRMHKFRVRCHPRSGSKQSLGLGFLLCQMRPGQDVDTGLAKPL